MTTPSARSDIIKKQTNNDIVPVQDSTPVRRRAVEKTARREEGGGAKGSLRASGKCKKLGHNNQL